MKFILDTDTLIYLLKGLGAIATKVSQFTDKELTTTIINHSELLFGAYNSEKKRKNIATAQSLLSKLNIIPFCEESSLIFAEQKALLKKQGNIIADMDLMIASIAIKHKYTLVTNNTKHFLRIKGLKIENWLN